jgi:Protein of unknown function (DUF1493)
MQDNVSARVFALAADERGRNIEKLEPQLTLQRDLGMDADDAVEFFDRFGREFSVDLRPLGEDWRYYFGPEGIPFRAALFLLIPGFTFSILFVRFLPRFPDWSCFLLGFAIWTLVLFGWTYLRGSVSNPQITIQGLIDCVHAGIWKNVVPEEVKGKLATRRRYVGF